MTVGHSWIWLVDVSKRPDRRFEVVWNVSRLGEWSDGGGVCNTKAADEEKKGEERMKSTTSAGIGGLKIGCSDEVVWMG